MSFPTGINSLPPDCALHLDRAGGFQVVHRDERVRHGLSHRQEAVIAEDERGVAAEIRDQARLLVITERRAFEVVVAEARQREDGML
jgi:hypothetical protein